MSAAKIAAIALIVVGVFALAYGGVTYNNGRQEVRIGSMSMSVTEHRTIPVPVWAGIAAVLLGTGLLVVPLKKV